MGENEVECVSHGNFWCERIITAHSFGDGGRIHPATHSDDSRFSWLLVCLPTSHQKVKQTQADGWDKWWRWKLSRRLNEKWSINSHTSNGGLISFFFSVGRYSDALSFCLIDNLSFRIYETSKLVLLCIVLIMIIDWTIIGTFICFSVSLSDQKRMKIIRDWCLLEQTGWEIKTKNWIIAGWR